MKKSITRLWCSKGVAVKKVKQKSPPAAERQRRAQRQLSQTIVPAVETMVEESGEDKGGEKLLRFITDAMPALISYIDTHQRYVMVNKSYERWFGHSTERVKGKHIREVLGEAAYREIKGYVEAALSGQTVNFEYLVPYKDGGTRYVNALYIPRFGVQGGVKGFVARVIDITERKKAEEQICRLNAELEQKVAERTEELGRANTQLQLTIAEIKQAEGVLRESGEKYKALVESSLTGTFIEQDDKYVYVNDRFAEMHGCKVEEIMGMEYQELIHPDERELVREIRVKRLKDEPILGPFMRRRLKKDGQVFWAEMMTTTIEYRDEPAIMGNIIDITERQQVEMELAEHREHLKALVKSRTSELETLNRQLQKELDERQLVEERLSTSLKEKEMLLREVHHRVKNNLQVISSLLSLQSRYTKNKQTAKVLEDSYNRVRTMAIIHEELHKSKNLDSIDFTTYINSLAANLFNAYAVNLDDITIKIDAPDDIRMRIEMAIPCGLVINELVSNSLKHAFPAGAKGKIGINLRRNEDKYSITVSDTGIGFPKDLDFRNSESLGLHLVNSLVDQLEGTLELDRTQGTSFTITIYGGVN